jgi:hypothetical protein
MCFDAVFGLKKCSAADVRSTHTIVEDGVERFLIHQPAREPEGEGDCDADAQTPEAAIFQGDGHFVLRGRGAKSDHEGGDAENNKDDGAEDDQDGVFRWSGFFGWGEEVKHTRQLQHNHSINLICFAKHFFKIVDRTRQK